MRILAQASSIIPEIMIRTRYRRIILFFGRIILSFAFWELILPRIGLRWLARRTRSKRLRSSATAFRKLAIQMGGVMIKVGQFLSTRVDVLPIEITSELSGLQDEVPPVNFPDICAVVEAEFGMPISEKFVRLEETPLAAASLGQAHRAWISIDADGQENVQDVVVKIQRPNIENIIATDLAALRTVGDWLRRYGPIRRRADIPALLDEFTRITYQEIDYLAEGHNAETFAKNFKSHPEIRVPSVYWTHTTKRALTLENVWGIKITDYEAISSSGVDRSEVATRLLNTYLKQIFEDGFFHADPHPGNLFVNPPPHPQEEESIPGDGHEWQLTFVDFGMVGHVAPNLLAGLRELLIGVGTQNAHRVVNSYQMLGVLLPGADLELIEKAEARVFEQFWGKNMAELSHISPQEVREFAGEYRELIYSLPFQVPHDMIFLARTVSILSGMCTGLDPEFNLWDHLVPYARKLIAEEGRAGGAALLEEIGALVRALVAVPKKLDTILDKMERGEIAVRAPEISRQVKGMDHAIRQVAGGIIFAALLLGGIQLFLAGYTPFGEILLAGSGLSLILTFLAGKQ
jgi:predicted unusual protein kinase regulating ubiquinone biosynthesis (AarF/ABC1/UbiB family)